MYALNIRVSFTSGFNIVSIYIFNVIFTSGFNIVINAIWQQFITVKID